jgi:hypothetical protein
MKQYCRYCSFCFEADQYRCSAEINGQQLYMTERDIKRPNKCPGFTLSELGDVITGRQYKPRKKKEAENDGQPSLFD